MADKRPKIFNDNETAHGLEQQLLHTAVECLSGRAAMVSQNRAERGNQELMVRFEQLLKGRRNAKPEIGEICRTLRTSERRLRLVCAAHLGMGPMTYERLRRLSFARQALRNTPSPKTVSVIARRYGFASLGRFAANYYAAYGELPSETLRHKAANTPATCSN
jgi:AraC family ethanolamine operon transcriptional activator